MPEFNSFWKVLVVPMISRPKVRKETYFLEVLPSSGTTSAIARGAFLQNKKKNKFIGSFSLAGEVIEMSIK